MFSMQKIKEYMLFSNLFIFHFFIYITYSYKDLVPHYLLLAAEAFFLSSTAFITILYCLHKEKHSFLCFYFVFIIILSYIVGLCNINGQEVDVDINTDLLICLFMINATFLTSCEPKRIIYFLKIVVISSVIIFIKDLLSIGSFDLIGILSRSYLWSEKFFFTGYLFWCSTFLIIFAFIFNKNYFFAFCSWGCAFILNMLALKRQFLVESLWLFIVLLFLFFKTGQYRLIKKFCVSFFVGISIFFAVIYSFFDIDLNILLNAQESRMSNDDIQSTGFVRFEESLTYFKSIDVADVFLGHGLGVPHHGLGIDKPNSALHIGVTNYINKFGVFLVFIYLYYLCRSIKLLPNINNYNKNDKWRTVCIMFNVCNAPSFLFLSNCWVVGPVVCFFWYSLIVATENNNTAEL